MIVLSFILGYCVGKYVAQAGSWSAAALRAYNYGTYLWSWVKSSLSK